MNFDALLELSPDIQLVLEEYDELFEDMLVENRVNEFASIRL